MKINKDWKMEADPLKITLLERSRAPAKGNKPAHDKWIVRGYYPSIQWALKGLVDFGVKETELKDLKTVVAKIDELHQLIDSLKF